MAAARVLAMVLAGGEGKRLMPLTADRAKPAVPFGGIYRMVDFALANLVNGGYLKVVVLTQYKSHSLDRHVTKTWRMSNQLGNYVTPVPAQQRRGPYWFAGSADAIYQSFNLIHDEKPDYIIVFGADHIYRMDPSQMVAHHMDSKAAVTVAGIRQPLAAADQFGVIEVGEHSDRIAAFREKPTNATGLPDAPDEVFASMGNYVFSTDALIEALTRDAGDPGSRHDMGGSIVPMMVERGEATVYDFRDNQVPGATDWDRAYWRDVGTLDSYYAAHMDLLAARPVFNLYNNEWPIYTENMPWPPAKFVDVGPGQSGRAVGSMISPGAIITGGLVEDSVISPDVHVHAGAHVQGSVIMEGADVGRDAVVHNAILDKNVVVPDGTQVGVDIEHDRARYTVSPSGVVVLGKGQRVVPTW
jgi:glucose-1-phosphate adenylyltransferase